MGNKRRLQLTRFSHKGAPTVRQLGKNVQFRSGLAVAAGQVGGLGVPADGGPVVALVAQAAALADESDGSSVMEWLLEVCQRCQNRATTSMKPKKA